MSVIFLLYYIVELAMRVIAYGLIFHPKAYLRNMANILDLCVILFGSVNNIYLYIHVHVWTYIFVSTYTGMYVYYNYSCT